MIKTFYGLCELWSQKTEEFRRFGSWCLAALPQHQGSNESLAKFITWLEWLLDIPALRTQNGDIEGRVNALEAENKSQAATIADLTKRLEALERLNNPRTPNDKPISAKGLLGD